MLSAKIKAKDFRRLDVIRKLEIITTIRHNNYPTFTLPNFTLLFLSLFLAHWSLIVHSFWKQTQNISLTLLAAAAAATLGTTMNAKARMTSRANLTASEPF